MRSVELRNKIVDKLNTVEDSSMLEYVLNFIENFEKNDTLSNQLSEKQLDELDERREKYLKGEEKSYSWQEIKQELINKHGL